MQLEKDISHYLCVLYRKVLFKNRGVVMTTAVCQMLRTLLLRKEKPTTSVTEWANASRQELNNIERTRSDRQEAQKQKAREIFGHILKE